MGSFVFVKFWYVFSIYKHRVNLSFDLVLNLAYYFYRTVLLGFECLKAQIFLSVKQTIKNKFLNLEKFILN